MDDRGSAAFWSYAHEDDRLDQGNISALAQHLTDEYSLITGEELQLFLDRNDLNWGDEWRARIDGALTETSFFIPIVTPRYFQRSECRKEATAFHSKAKSLGVEELVLPVLYIPVKDFDSSNRDEVVALLSRYQYVDWTSLRLAGPSSSEYRRAIHELAQRLASLATAVGAKLLENEIKAVQVAEDPGNDKGILDVMEEIEPLLPDWLEAIESSHVGEAQFLATWELFAPRLARAERSPGSGSARFALIQRLATEELPLARRYLQNAEVFGQKTLELDPLILQVLKLCEDVEDVLPYIEPLRASLMKAHRDVKEWRETLDIPTAGQWARKRAHVSRVVREVADVFEHGERIVSEGNSLIENWVSEWERVTGEPLDTHPVESAPDEG